MTTARIGVETVLSWMRKLALGLPLTASPVTSPLEELNHPGSPREMDPDWLGWPPAADSAASGKIFEAQVAARGRRIDAAIARAQANRDADLAQNAEFQEALIDVAKNGLDRARANAETVQKSAGAIGTIYTGVLGLAFSVTSRPMPTRAALPALFLGVAVASSTAYLAYLSRREDTRTMSLDATPTGIKGQFERVTFLLRWIRRPIRQRVWLLRSSVVALAVGVALLPLPFIDLRVASTSRPSSPSWPTPNGDLSAELQKIQFQAEVDEVSQLRLAQSTAPDDTAMTIGVGLLGLTLVVLGGAVARQKDELDVKGPEVRE